MWALNEGLLLTFCLFFVLAYFDAHLLKMQQTYISNITAMALLSHIVAGSLLLKTVTVYEQYVGIPIRPMCTICVLAFIIC